MSYQYRKGEIVVGSTKGSARIEPRSYKGDSLIQVWLDSRKIAMLSMWLSSRGVTTRFMSDVIREALDQLCTHLVNSGQGIELDTTAARDLLESKYRVNLNPSGKGIRNLMNNLILDDRKAESTRVACEVDLNSFGDEGPPIDHPLRGEWRRRVLDANYPSKAQQYEQAKVKEEEEKQGLEEKYAHLNKDNVVPTTKPVQYDIEDKTMRPASNELLEKLKCAKTTEEKRAIIYQIKANHEEDVKRQRLEEELKEKAEKKRAKALRKAGIEVNSISDTPRHKTDEELRLDNILRQKKERNLIAALDHIPTTRTSSGSSQKIENNE